MSWSPKQQSFIAHSNAFLNVCDGAVRSGKTHANLIAFAAFCAAGPPGDLGVFGRTERTVKRNVVYPLMAGLPKGSVRYVQGSGELYVFGRRCWIFGANDVRAEEKVQGSTLAGGYMNEVTLYPESLVDQAIARTMTIKGARFFLDCNPDSPYHWFYRKYLEGGHPKQYLKRWRFRLADNPILPRENVEMLKALYGPGTLFYRRNIDGQWVVAEGAVYEQWDERLHVVEEMPGRPEKVVIGVDVGTQNPTVFLAAGKVGRTWYVFAEYYHSGRESGRQKTNGEYSADFVAWLSRLGYYHSSVEIDPSAADFKVQLRRDGISGVRDADNALVPGIRTVSTALTEGTLKVLKSCERLRAEFPSYTWDPKKQEQGVDMPMKANDHALDALRYLARRVLNRPDLRVVRKPVGF